MQKLLPALPSRSLGCADNVKSGVLLTTVRVIGVVRVTYRLSSEKSRSNADRAVAKPVNAKVLVPVVWIWSECRSQLPARQATDAQSYAPGKTPLEWR